MSTTSASVTEPHPRPQLERHGWISLNGQWNFALDIDGQWGTAEEVLWDREILVPFAPETKASGVAFTGFFQQCWYRRQFKIPNLKNGDRLILHFGAVDYHARVWVNGKLAVEHEGGYVPFHADITDLLEGPIQTIVVCASDDPHDLAKPRGKQDWQLEPHSIWYPRTSGIWQTVWLEPIPATSIRSVRWVGSVDRWEIGVDVRITGPRNDGLRLAIELWEGNTVLVDDSYVVKAEEITRKISLPDPGIDDYRNELLWSPSKPTLIQARLQLVDADGTVIDTIRSYTALRSIAVQGDKLVLNGRPYPLRLIWIKVIGPTRVKLLQTMRRCAETSS